MTVNEYTRRLVALEAEARDVPLTARSKLLMTASLSAIDAFCLKETGRKSTWDEFAGIAKKAFEMLHGALP